MSVVIIVLVMIALATSGRSQEPEIVEVFEEGDAVAGPNEVISPIICFRNQVFDNVIDR